MAQNKRHKGVTLERRIVYGSVAVPLETKQPGNEDHTHTWAVYLRGHNNEDISHFIKRVTFKLHHSFEQPQRVFEEPPYIVQETGWGEFEIQIKIKFIDPAEKDITLFHALQLYPKEDPTTKTETGRIVYESYEELVFQDPTELMFQVLTSYDPAKNPSPEPRKKYVENSKDPKDPTKNVFTPEFEQLELTKYTTAVQNLLNEQEQIKEKIRLASETLERLRSM